MDKFDLSTLTGASFNVIDEMGATKTVKAIRAELLFEVIRAHTLLIEDPHCEVTELLDLFTGFIDSPYDVTWFTTTDPKQPVEQAIKQAVMEGNEIVVIEILPMFDPDHGGQHLDK